MVTAGPDFYIHTTNNEYPDPGKHSCTPRFVLVSRHRTLSMLHLNFSKCPLENKSPVHTGQHFSTPNFHVSKPTLENERPAHTVQHFCILVQPFYLMGNPLFFRTSWGTNDVTMKSQWNHNGITMKSQWNQYESIWNRNETTNEITMESQWNHNVITMKSQCNHNGITMKSQWHHNGITMKSLRNHNDITMESMK